jgi:hypothetical protein
MVLRGHIITLKPYLDKISSTAYEDCLLDFWKQACRDGGGDVNPVLTVTLMVISNSKEHSKFDVFAFNKIADDWYKENCDTGACCSTNAQCADKFWTPSPEKAGSTVDPNRTRLIMCGCKCGHSNRCYRACVTWSDNCCGQYKNRHSAYWVSCQLAEGHLPRWWLTHGASHGKCLCDGEGGRAKHMINEACLESLTSSTVAQRFQTASDVAEYLKINFTTLHSTLASRSMRGVHSRVVFYVDAKDIKVTTETFTEVKGIRSAHRILNNSNTKGTFLMGNYACICDGCLSGDFTTCTNPHGRSKVKTMKVNPITLAARLTRAQVKQHGTALANTCNVGMNIAFSTTEVDAAEFDGEPYFIGKVKEVLQAAPADRLCPTFGTRIKQKDHFLVVQLHTRKDHSLRIFEVCSDDAKFRLAFVPGKCVVMVGVDLNANADGGHSISSSTHIKLMRVVRNDESAGEATDAAAVMDFPADEELPTDADPGVIRLAPTTESRKEEMSFTAGDAGLLLDDAEDDGMTQYSATPKLPKGTFKIGKLMARFEETVKRGKKKCTVVKWSVHWAGYDYTSDSPEFEEGFGHGCPGLKDGVTSDVWKSLVVRFRSQFDGFPPVVDIPHNVSAYDHVQCSARELCCGQRYYNTEDIPHDLCHVCSRRGRKWSLQ